MSTEARAAGQQGWLYRPAIDLLVILGPWLFTAVFAFGMPAGSGQAKAVWLTQFVLGNTTHVILTFLLLGVRPDILRATPNQAKLVAIGSVVTFFVIWGLLRAVDTLAPTWHDFPVAVLGVFGSHHRLSQAKGVWSLYNLRAGKIGYGPPSAQERSLQQHWVSVGLILVMVAWLFVPSGPDRMFPLLQAIPAEPAFLPYSVAYGLAAIWVIFVAALLVVVARTGFNVAKLAHIATHGGAVALAILAPAWGAIVWGAIHGLEYYFLCARMMERREGDAVTSPPAWLVWPLMALAMAPLVVVGLGATPFATKILSGGAWVREGVAIVNGIVAAHYFADAFIYRFRIPEVRRVALHRLGFA